MRVACGLGIDSAQEGEQFIVGVGQVNLAYIGGAGVCDRGVYFLLNLDKCLVQ